MLPRPLAALALLVPLAAAAAARLAQDEPAMQPLFDGRTLAGWVGVNCAPDTWTARDGMIVCSGKPNGVLRTERMFENFVLELEYRHVHAGGNAGVFVWSDPLPAKGVPFTRSIEVQVMDGIETPMYTSHGDVFAIHGAKMTPARPHPAGWMRCLPSEKRAKPAPEWNHYRLTCDRGTIRLEVNGEEVSGAHDVSPRKGYLCLESEGSEVHFRNLRIAELPPSPEPLAPELVAEEARGFESLYDGKDFAGWRHEAVHEGHWKASDSVIDFDGGGASLWSTRELGDFELVVDWRWSGEPQKKQVPIVQPDGTYALDESGAQRLVEIDEAGDSGILLRGDERCQVNIWCWPVGSGEVWGYRSDASTSPEVRAACTPKVAADAPLGQWNRFEIRMVGEVLDVRLNGQVVIEGARLPGAPARGPIGLQQHGSPIQFTNLFVREL